MNKKVNSKMVISTIQILCVLCWDIYYRFLSPSSPADWFYSYGVPVIISSTVTFLFCILSSNELRFKEIVRLSFPVCFVYLIAYAIVPSVEVLIDDYSFEGLGFTIVVFFLYDLPLAALLLFANSSAGWFGSLLHTKLFKHRDNSSSAAGVH
jgi:hypothetical protein